MICVFKVSVEVLVEQIVELFSNNMAYNVRLNSSISLIASSRSGSAYFIFLRLLENRLNNISVWLLKACRHVNC